MCLYFGYTFGYQSIIMGELFIFNRILLDVGSALAHTLASNECEDYLYLVPVSSEG